MKTLIAIPAMDMMHTPFVNSLLGLRRVGDVGVSITVSTLVHDARNRLAKQAVDEGYDRILWLDSDMIFQPDLMERLSADLDEGRDLVTGVYYRRKSPFTPTIYEDVGLYNDGQHIYPDATVYKDYPRDEIFEIQACGFGAVMHTTDILKRVGEKLGPPFAMVPGFGEDISFCMRCAELGIKMYCDPTIKLGHLAMFPVDEDFVKVVKT